MSPKLKFADSAKFNTYALVFLVLGVSLLVAALSYFNVPKLSLNTSAAALQGDLNNDGIVNSIDWSVMNSKWLTSDAAADLNSDGLVNTVDWSIMNANWLKTAPPPPPPADTTAPTVSITAPANGATVSGTVTVSASASDNVGVVGVQFKVNGANQGTEDTSSPYSISWATGSLSNGSYTITAVARDAAGNTKASSAVTVTVSNVVPPPPPTGGSSHSYFNNLISRPDKLAAYSLRDPAQLQTRANGGYAQCNACPLDVTYTYPNDPDPRKQDAAKIVIGTSNLNSLRNQLQLPIPQYSGAFMVTWDAWWGSEFKYANSGIPTYKAWQLANAGSIWTEPRSLFSQGGSNGIAKVDMRYYGTPGPGTTKIGDALAPMLATYIIAPETWTRYWVYINPAGSWYELSYWMADENQAPVQILDKRLVTNKFNGARWDEFWVEFNTSTDAVKPGRGNLVAYVRNVAILHGLSFNTVTSLLQKPLP